MQQAFGGIKEIKIANREAYFEGEFVKQNGLYTYVIKQNSFLSSIPKPIMEALCITGLMAAIIVRINATSTSRSSLSEHLQYLRQQHLPCFLLQIRCLNI